MSKITKHLPQQARSSIHYSYSERTASHGEVSLLDIFSILYKRRKFWLKSFIITCLIGFIATLFFATHRSNKFTLVMTLPYKISTPVNTNINANTNTNANANVGQSASLIYAPLVAKSDVLFNWTISGGDALKSWAEKSKISASIKSISGEINDLSSKIDSPTEVIFTGNSASNIKSADLNEFKNHITDYENNYFRSRVKNSLQYLSSMRDNDLALIENINKQLNTYKTAKVASSDSGYLAVQNSLNSSLLSTQMHLNNVDFSLHNLHSKFIASDFVYEPGKSFFSLLLMGVVVTILLSAILASVLVLLGSFLSNAHASIRAE